MITINEQSSIRLNLDKIIYFDPFHLLESKHDADIIFITHAHYDHFSIEDILKVKKETTIIVCPYDCVEEVGKFFSTDKIIAVQPQDHILIAGYPVTVVDAYNIDKPFHSKENKWVGYLFQNNDVTYYVMGDTDVLPFMEKLKVDYLFIPIGGKFTMNVEEAVSLVNKMKPKVAIPIHYGTIVGESTLGASFQKQLNDEIECQLHLFPSLH